MTARLVECTFIAIGIVCMLAISSLRQDAPLGPTPRSGRASSRSMSGRSGSGRALRRHRERPDPGVADVPIRLVPPFCPVRAGRWSPVSIVGLLVILGVIPADGLFQVLVAPEFIWEPDRHLSHRQGLPDLVSGPRRDPRGRRLARLGLNPARPAQQPRATSGLVLEVLTPCQQPSWAA